MLLFATEYANNHFKGVFRPVDHLLYSETVKIVQMLQFVLFHKVTFLNRPKFVNTSHASSHWSECIVYVPGFRS